MVMDGAALLGSFQIRSHLPEHLRLDCAFETSHIELELEHVLHSRLRGSGNSMGHLILSMVQVVVRFTMITSF